MDNDDRKAAREYFIREVIMILRALPRVRDVRESANFSLDVDIGDGLRARIHLANVFWETRDMSAEERRARILAAYGSVGGAAVPPWSQARKVLVPTLRSATYSIGMWANQPSATPIRRPFLPFLDEVVVLDQPTTMMPVLRGMVSEWEVDEQAVFSLADSRKHRFSAPSARLYDDKDGPLWIVNSGDNYEASRLLVPGWLAGFRGRVEGEPIAILPQRSIVMIGGDRRPSMVQRLLEKAGREFEASARSISPALYSVNAAGRVIPYERAGSDELSMAVRSAHYRLASAEYEAQRDVFKRFSRIHVSNYNVISRRDTGETRSYAIWRREIESYLPQTDRIFLAPGGDPSEFVDVPFCALESRLKPLADSHPPLFETGKFPSAEELAELAASAGA